MSVIDHRFPRPGTLDFLASVARGWDPSSGEQSFSGRNVALIRAGKISIDSVVYTSVLRALSDRAQQSNGRVDLLEPLYTAVTDSYPSFHSPHDEPLVAIDPRRAEELGVVPVATHWQSGWDRTTPYVVVREGVYGRLIQAARKLQQLDPQARLFVMDGWRSFDHQQEIFDAVHPGGAKLEQTVYANAPVFTDNSMTIPAPCTGGAVSVFLGFGDNALELGSELDQYSDKSRLDYFEPEGRGMNFVLRDARRILHNVMRSVGFLGGPMWWEFEFGTFRHAKLTGQKQRYDFADIRDPKIFEGIDPVEAVLYSRRRDLLRDPSAVIDVDQIRTLERSRILPTPPGADGGGSTTSGAG